MEKVTVPLAGGPAYDIWTGPAAGLALIENFGKRR